MSNVGKTRNRGFTISKFQILLLEVITLLITEEKKRQSKTKNVENK